MKRKTKIAIDRPLWPAARWPVRPGSPPPAGDDDATEAPITGSALDKATAAALDHTGGGTVTGTEVGDEESLLRGRGDPRRRRAGRRPARRGVQRRRQRRRQRVRGSATTEAATPKP